MLLSFQVIIVSVVVSVIIVSVVVSVIIVSRVSLLDSDGGHVHTNPAVSFWNKANLPIYETVSAVEDMPKCYVSQIEYLIPREVCMLVFFIGEDIE